MSYALHLASYAVFIAAGCFAVTVGARSLRLVPSHYRALRAQLKDIAQ
jgi:hypothetical protein